MKIRALFIVNGLGLGNSTRCHAIIEQLLEKNVEVLIVTSGNGLWYFKEMMPNHTIYELEALQYGQSTDGSLSIFKTLLAIPLILKTLSRNRKNIREYIKFFSPNVIVTDSDYTISFVPHGNIPVVAINNANIIVEKFFQFNNKPFSIFGQFFVIELMDYFYHKVVPDLIISPTFEPENTQKKGKFHLVHPPVRKGYTRKQKNIDNLDDVKNVLIMLSGSAFSSQINLLKNEYPVHIDVVGRGVPDNYTPSKKIVFRGKIINTLPILENAGLVIINGGCSAVSEILTMRIPAIVIPVPNHAEQWVNARVIEKLGVGIISDEASIESALFEALGKIKDFRKSYESLVDFEDGSSQAATVIINLVEKN